MHATTSFFWSALAMAVLFAVESKAFLSPSICPLVRPRADFATQRSLFDLFKQDDPEKPQKEEEVVAESMKEEKDFSDDPVDKIFSFFFGEKEEAPMGMKRFGQGEE